MNDIDFQAGDSIQHLVYRLKLDPNSNVCVVSHKSLYDEGCVRFFGWLSTGILNGISHTTTATPVWTSDKEKPTRPFPRSLDSLELWDVHMGDEGFQALLDWLKGLREPLFPLTKLSLRANEIQGDAQLATQFVSASPRLASLILSSNPLSPEFKRTLFSLLLELPCLAALHLSMTGLDSTDARALAAYISSSRCKLVELHASCNNLGYKGLRALVRAMQHCWTMEKMDVYGNDNEADDQDDSESDDEWGGWESLKVNMRNILARNVFLKRQTAREAPTLLKYSRLMLQPLPKSPETVSSCADCDCIPVAPQNTEPPPSRSPFHALPVEIQLSVLSQLAPTLSTQQRLRVFAFATDLSTLPSLRLRLPASNGRETQCLPDPGSLAFPSQMTGKRFGSLRRETTMSIHTCGDGNCMGNKSMLCKRKTDRQKWLEQIGCDSYDPK